jgi:predicted ATPase/DNA-binding SARP family transcriptional activator
LEIIYRIRLLGTVQVEKNGALLRNFESRKALALLGYLARHDQPVSRSHLAGLFWGDKEEARGRRNLSRELSQLSAQLPGCFQADYYTVQFQPPASYWVDTCALAELVKTGLGKSELSAASIKVGPPADIEKSVAAWFPPYAAEDIQPEQLAQAVALYRGDFMAGYFLDDCPEFETWLIREQEGWRRQVTEILERLIAYHALLGQDEQARLYARRWLGLEPWRERAHRYLMLLLARSGERSGALAQYEICRRALAEELAVEPGAETVVLYEQIRKGELSRGTGEQGGKGEILPAPLLPRSSAPPPSLDPLPSAAPLPLHTLPNPSTLFIGREDELAQIATYLSDPACRLLTLVGPGGIGKTRLAIQAVWQASSVAVGPRGEINRFRDGIYFIPLDSLSSAEFLVSTLADALNFSFYSGTDPTSQLLNYLREKCLLLVLDNFEHLMDGTGLLADILKQAPQVKILAVSRERLNLQEEYLLPVPGLKIPDAQASRVKQQVVVEAYSAVQLFLHRAQTVQPGFSLSEEHKACIVRICRLAEGIPLAIELAAAWVRLLSCQEIAQEIEHNLDFLTTSLRNVPERQRSLRAVFDYSWQLLSAEERRVFRQLAVFRGGFQLEAARQVAGASLPLLLALVDKSLLRRTASGRYTRHILLWQYAAEKLAETPQEKETIQNRHGDYYMAFLHQKETLLKGGDQKAALAEIGAEIENIRAGWRWAIEQGQVSALEQTLESLFHFYDMRGWFKEGMEAFGLAATTIAGEVRQGDEEVVQPAKSRIILGKILARQGWFTFQLGQHEPAKRLLQKSLALLSSLNDNTEARQEAVFALNYLGSLHRHLGEYWPAQQYLQESMAICREAGDRFGLSVALNILSQVAYLEGDYTQARQLGQESLVLKQKIGDRRGLTFSLNNLGQVAYTLGEYPQAKDLFQESLAICQEMGDRRGIALCLSFLGDVVQMMGEYQGAKQLYQESLAIFKEIGNQWGSVFSRTKLGNVACALGDYQAAGDYFDQSLQMALDIQAMPGVIDALVGLASLLIKTGDAKQEQVLEILALALSHPASSRDIQDRAARLLAELQPHLPPGAIKAIQTEQTNTLEMIAQKMLAEGRG